MTRISPACTLLATLLLGFCLTAEARIRDQFAGFSAPELDQMLAPIALYPDTVLAHVLIAATYPIEVVQAARWTRQHPDLRGEAAVNAVIGRDWDPSVMALVAFPELLARMDDDLDWTQRLGDAFLIQEGDVLDSIQRLRALAYQAGHLRSGEQVRVIREREVIYIEPPRRQVVFVPVYDTRVVYGTWAWAHHPPIFWYPATRHRSTLVVHWGPVFHVPSAFFFSSFHWPQRQVVVVHHHHYYYRGQQPRRVVQQHHHHYQGRDLARHEQARHWQHEPAHRRGVAYPATIDERHGRLAQRADRAPGEQRQAPVRRADTQAGQREWAAARRAEPILPQARRTSDRSTGALSEPPVRTRPATAPAATARPATSVTRSTAPERNAQSTSRQLPQAPMSRGDRHGLSTPASRAAEPEASRRSIAVRPAPAPQREAPSSPPAAAITTRTAPDRAARSAQGRASSPSPSAPAASQALPARSAAPTSAAATPFRAPPPAPAESSARHAARARSEGRPVRPVD